MFTFNTAIDAYVAQTKSLLTHVQHEPAKTTLMTVLHAQESFAKSLAKQIQSATESAVKQAQEVVKTDWSKLFVVTK
jgi:chemotaxis response regulator CheB